MFDGLLVIPPLLPNHFKEVYETISTAAFIVPVSMCYINHSQKLDNFYDLVSKQQEIKLVHQGLN